MGLRFKLICPQCGHSFRREYGLNVLGKGTLYCNRCGSAQPVDLSMGWIPVPECSCGGTFDADALGCCPVCKAVLGPDAIDPSSPPEQFQ